MKKCIYSPFLLLPLICLSTAIWARGLSPATGAIGLQPKGSLDFIENKGQWIDAAKFKANIPGGVFFITNEGFVYNYVNHKDLEHIHDLMERGIADFGKEIIHQHAYKVNFVNANNSIAYEQTEKKKAYHNYFIGNEPSKWSSNVGLFGKVIQKNVYTGIDVAVYSKDHSLKYDFIVAPGASPDQIALAYEGVVPVISSDGDLILRTSINEVVEKMPYSYQVIDGKEVEVKSYFTLNQGIVSFSFPNGYDPKYTLVIDPVLVFATYSGAVGGGSGFFSYCTTYDEFGNMYAGAQAYGAGWPVTTGAIQSTFNGSQDVAVNKYNSNGSDLIYSTYFGGTGVDLPHAMKVNAKDELVIVGSTISPNLPVTSDAYDKTLNGTDIFVAHFNNSGTVLLGSTYLGGSSMEPLPFTFNTTGVGLNNQNTTSPLELDFDGQGNMWVVSNTRSTDFPVVLPNGYTTYKINRSLCKGDTLYLGKEMITAPGTYTDTFATLQCDSIITWDIRYSDPVSDTFDLNLCPGSTYVFGSQIINSAGIYSQLFHSGKCDSTVTLRVSMDTHIMTTIADTACAGYPYIFGARSLIVSGIYTDTFSTSACDSIVTLNLFVRPYLMQTLDQEMCPSGSYYFGKSVLVAAGTYVDTFSTSGCDRIITLNLRSGNLQTYTVYEEKCAGATYVFGTKVITNPGTYTDTFKTSGCDSIVTLVLSNRALKANAADAWFCPGDTYAFGNQILSLPGTYTHTFSNGGCDSIVTLSLARSKVYDHAFVVQSCSPDYVFGNQILSTPGIYSQTFTSALGCDSVVTIDLTFKSYIRDTVIETICSGGSYSFGSRLITSQGLYIDTFATSGCDSIVTLVLKTTLSRTAKGGIDGVLFQLNPSCSQLLFSGYLGGTEDDAIVSIQMTRAGNIAICGTTKSSDFPTTPFSLNPIAPGGTFDGFLSVINPASGIIERSTYLGTAGIDNAVALQLDDNDTIYVLGRTDGNYPISTGTFNVANGDLFIDKISPDLSGSLLSTRLGNAQSVGSRFYPAAFLLDICKNVYVTGINPTAGMPVSSDALNKTGGPFWFGVLTTNFENLFFGSYFGATGDHTHVGISRMDPQGIVYHSICNNTATYPLATTAFNPNPYRLNKASTGQDVVSFKFNFEAAGVHSDFILDPVTNPKDTGCVPFTVSFLNTSNIALEYLWDFNDGPGSTSTEPNPIYTFNREGVYKVVLYAYNENTCIKEDSSFVMLTVLKTDKPEIEVRDTLVCQGVQYIDLSVTIRSPSANNTIEWGPQAGILYAEGTVARVNPNVETVYYVTVKDTIPGICGFSTTDSIHIDFKPRALKIFNNDSMVCFGTTVQIFAEGTEGYSYSWTPANGVSDTNLINPRITLNESNIYVLTASYEGCPDTIQLISFEVEEIPFLQLAKDTSICKGSEFVLLSHVTPYRNDYIYKWSPAAGLKGPDNQPHARSIADTSITYTLHVASPLGCSAEESIRVFVFPGIEGSIISDTGYCLPGMVQLWATGGSIYHWTPAYGLNNPDIENPQASPGTSTDYTVYITDTKGCKDTQYVNVQVYPAAVMELPDSISIYPGEVYHLQSSTNAHYFQWFPPSGLNDPNIADPSFYPEVRTRYFVVAKTENGCLLRDSVDVLVKETVIAMPNAFHPGGGINNTFKASKRGIAKLNEFSIYNRWGNKVFSTANINEGWDGSYNGQPQPVGTYIYTIEAQSENGKTFKRQGNVTLLR